MLRVIKINYPFGKSLDFIYYICTMNSGIYQIRNLINNKVYVGSSINLSSRKYSHFNSLKNNTHCNKYLQRSYNKYGINNFLFSILEKCEENVLIKREISWILLLNSNNSKFGYNEMIPDEDRICHSENTKRKISKSKSKGYKKILQYSKDGIFIKEYIGIKEAAKENNITPDGIIHSIKKYIKSGEFYWRYYLDNYSKYIAIPISKRGKLNGIRIKAYNDNECYNFNSFAEAILFLGGNCDYFRVQIKKCCDNEKDNFKGFNWKYI